MNAERRFAEFGLAVARSPSMMTGIGLPSPQPASSPLTAWTVSIAAVDRWLATSKPEDRLIYAHGSLTDQALGAHVRQLMAAGELALRQERNAVDRAIDYVAVRKTPAKAERPERQASNAELYKLALLGRMTRAANRGLRAPLNKELAAELELPESTVKWLVRQLVDAGKIAVEVEQSATGRNWRVVTIIASGNRTARAPR